MPSERDLRQPAAWILLMLGTLSIAPREERINRLFNGLSLFLKKQDTYARRAAYLPVHPTKTATGKRSRRNHGSKGIIGIMHAALYIN
jgi:hypothetical protein